MKHLQQSGNPYPIHSSSCSSTIQKLKLKLEPSFDSNNNNCKNKDKKNILASFKMQW